MSKASLFLLLLSVLWLLSCGQGRETGEMALGDALGNAEREGYAKALEPRPFIFPSDHGPHPEFRNEWWYVTGNLLDVEERRYGFQLTLFRIALTPEIENRSSAWAVRDVYMGHLALTDAANQRFYAFERFSRGSTGLAGADGDPVHVWLENWQIVAEQGSLWRLEARENDVALQLDMRPLKPIVLQGDDGLSQKSAEPGNASYYYSIPRLAVTGTISLGEYPLQVRGTAWLDREWSTSALGEEQQGWDWFALQLSDGSELMYYRMRRKDGGEDAQSQGVLIAQNGTSTKLSNRDINLQELERWGSPEGGEYPSRWSLATDTLILEITPILKNQELDLTVRYWEGAVDVRGTKNGKPVDGWGYVELTGYAR